MYDFDVFFEEKVKEIAKEDFILDAGGGIPFQKRMAPYKSLFEGKRYATLDNAPEYKPTIVGDIHAIPLKDGEVGAVICLSVMEHLPDPQKAAKEMWRVLRPGGKLLLYTHFIYPYHIQKGLYGDYFRFTDEGLRHLVRDFSSVEVKKHGGYFRALMFFLPGQARLRKFLEPVAYALDKALGTEKRSTTAGYYIYAIK